MTKVLIRLDAMPCQKWYDSQLRTDSFMSLKLQNKKKTNFFLRKRRVADVCRCEINPVCICSPALCIFLARVSQCLRCLFLRVRGVARTVFKSPMFWLGFSSQHITWALRSWSLCHTVKSASKPGHYFRQQTLFTSKFPDFRFNQWNKLCWNESLKTRHLLLLSSHEQKKRREAKREKIYWLLVDSHPNHQLGAVWVNLCSYLVFDFCLSWCLPWFSVR